MKPRFLRRGQSIGAGYSADQKALCRIGRGLHAAPPTGKAIMRAAISPEAAASNDNNAMSDRERDNP